MADLLMYADHFLKEFINEAVLGVAYETHRALTRGTLFLDESVSDEEDDKYKIVVANGLDIFGQPIGGSKKNVECVCPNCNRNMAASRFAPHLEKCMGMGRNSSRIASQRIANSGKLASAVSDGLGVDDDVDDANDADWMAACETSSSRKAKKRKGDRSNNGIQRSAKVVPSKLKNSPKISSSSSSQQSGTSERFQTDHNSNVRNLNYINRLGQDSRNVMNENVNHTVSIWQKHINDTLMGPNSENDTSAAKQSPSNAMVKKTKKSSKHAHSKKNKKRPVSSQPSAALT